MIVNRIYLGLASLDALKYTDLDLGKCAAGHYELFFNNFNGPRNKVTIKSLVAAVFKKPEQRDPPGVNVAKKREIPVM